MDPQLRPLNVLMLGGAKRVSLAKHFIATAAKMGFEARLYSLELSKNVPIASVAEVVIGGKWNDPDLMNQLSEICAEKNIDIILPFVDGAVEIAASFCQINGNVWSPVSAPEVCRAMFDKKLADKVLRENDIPLPRVVDTVQPQFFPIIAKPRTGSASIGILVVNDIEQWLDRNLDVEKYIVQEYIANRREYTLDCYIDRKGNISAISPRLRIEVAGGEVVRSLTVDLPAGTEIARAAINVIGLRGAVTVQLIENVDTGELMLMEINPRLGGGVVCSLYADTNILEMIINDWQGREVKYKKSKAGIEMTRFMQEIVFDSDNNIISLS